MNTNEIKRRRTFAIISHPDAGKTTLTEKLLLYGGALQAAGAVRAKKNQRAHTRALPPRKRSQDVRLISMRCPPWPAAYSLNQALAK